MAARDTQVGGVHYQGMVQPWDVVDTWPLEQQVGAYRHGILKYTMRMGDKDERLQEICKAQHYTEKLIEVLEQIEADVEPEAPVQLTQEEWDVLNEAALGVDMSSRVITGKAMTQELLDEMDTLEQERAAAQRKAQEGWYRRTQNPCMAAVIYESPVVHTVAPGKTLSQPNCFTHFPAESADKRRALGCHDCTWCKQCLHRSPLARPQLEYPWPAD